MREQTPATRKVVSRAALVCLEEELTFSVEIASFWKFSAKETSYDEACMRRMLSITLDRSVEESDLGELAVSLSVETGDLDHVLSGGAELLQAGPPVPLT